MKRSLFIVLSLIILTTFLAGPSSAENYAVLISAGETTADHKAYHSEFWYDLILIYTTLIDEGYEHENIYVLYGSGTDFESTEGCYVNPYGQSITDFDNSQSTIIAVFDSLSTIMLDADFLFVWWMGHGAPNDGDVDFRIENTGEVVHDYEFASYVKKIRHYRQKMFSFMTCFSGGILDDLEDPTSIVMTSATNDQPSASAILCDTQHAEFNYHSTAALHWQTPCYNCGSVDADENEDGRISFGEAFSYAQSGTARSEPQLSDAGYAADGTYLVQSEIFVAADGSGDYPTIQTAINAAQDLDVIILGDGIFTGPENRELDLLGKRLAICSQSGHPDNCIIDCEDDGNGIYFYYGETPVTLLGGVSIINGNSSFPGGAVYCDGSSPRISNCRIVDNSSVQSGGGVFLFESSPRMIDCRISGNNTSQMGGGIYFENASPTLAGCTVTANGATGNGGGLYMINSHPSLTSCTLSDNNSTLSGGGIYTTLGSSPSVNRTIIWGNTANGLGDELYVDINTSVTLECSDIDPAGIFELGTIYWEEGNIITDPMFCGGFYEDPYTINSDSPCAPENNPYCGLIGAWPVGCGGDLEVGITPLNGQEFDPGDIIIYEAWITNNSDSPLPVMTYIYASNVSVWQLMLYGPLMLTIPPQTTLGPVTLHSPIPMGAPPMTAYMCITANEVHDCFQVTVH